MDSTQNVYKQLIAYLDEQGAHYRLIDHAPEGRTDVVSQLRGNPLAQAAKCMVVMVKIGKKDRQYCIAVVPGDRKVDLNALKALYQGDYVTFVAQDVAERLTGCVAGTILPFSFNSELPVIVDPTLLTYDEIVFNAARLDQSMYLKTADYVRTAKPRSERITASDVAPVAKAISQPAAGPIMWAS